MSRAEDDAYYTEGDEPPLDPNDPAAGRMAQGDAPIHKLPANYFAVDSDEQDDEELQAIAHNIGE